MNSYFENPDTLMHYGVKGMKWGVRRDKRNYQKRLNRLDQESVNELAKTMKATRTAKTADRKLQRRISKKPETSSRREIEKRNSLEQKSINAAKKAVDHMNKSKSIDSRTWEVAAEAIEKGYSVNSKQVYRNGERGRTYAQALLAGPFGSAVINSTRVDYYMRKFDGQTPWAVRGNKYKVR